MRIDDSVYEKISPEESRAIQLEILKRFDEICSAHLIKYSLACGTLLGAVRHGGFIPWDDDIDVMMLRSEFEKFYALATTTYRDDRYKLVSMYNVKDYFSPLPKFYDSETLLVQDYGQAENDNYGVYVDVFIVDFLPDEGQEAFYLGAQKLRKKWGCSCRKVFSLHHQSRNVLFDILGTLAALPYKICGKNHYRDKYDAYCRRYETVGGKNVAVVEFGESLARERMDFSQMDEPETVTFEGRVYPCVRDKERYLTNMFGDYMQLPPEDQRVSKHKNAVYRRK